MRNYLVWQILSCGVLVSPVKFFEEEDLTNEEFEKYPVVSRDERESEACEGVMEVEEVRSVEGEEMSKITLMDLKNLHSVMEDSRTVGNVEIWHR